MARKTNPYEPIQGPSDPVPDSKSPVAIIGLGGIFPKALNIPEFWRNIVEERDCIIEVPLERWDWRLYFSQDRKAVDKTYSKIGGFIEGFKFNPLEFKIPPGVSAQMDTIQQLALAATQEALIDSGYDKKPFDREKTAVIIANAMGGPRKEATDFRVYSAGYKAALEKSPQFRSLNNTLRQALVQEIEKELSKGVPPVSEDTMPGELSNVIAGRIASVFNLNGPNFTVDAACAASLAAVDQAVKSLKFYDCDMALCGGVDQMMTPPAYVKFSKIGAISGDRSRPFDARANGFVMGEGAGIIVLKRLTDALRDGDRIYALIRAIGSSSDGKGKGITAPNPKGQRLAIQRTFEKLDYGPETVELVEAHGTATPVGDEAEFKVLCEIFGPYAKGRQSIGLGSIKSQIGHLKAAAGVASLIKAALAVYHKVLPPSINFEIPNPEIDFENSPFRIVTKAEEWKSNFPKRRVNVSAFGFGGTNFHVALEENREAVPSAPAGRPAGRESAPAAPLPHLQGEAYFVRASKGEEALEKMSLLQQSSPDYPLILSAHKTNTESQKNAGNYAISFAAESPSKLKEKCEILAGTLKTPEAWEKPPISFKPKGLYVRKSIRPRPKIGFLFPGQGSQYVDMMKDLFEKYQVVRETFEEADTVMKGLIGEKLTEIIFSKPGETAKQIAERENRIKQTEITQPAVLAADIAILRLLDNFGVKPDAVCGHSLGEYGALVASGILGFKDALVAVSARAKEMADVKVPDPGKMGSVSAPCEAVEPVLKNIPGYVIIANKNCPTQTVIAGETASVETALKKFSGMGIQVQEVRVSHAFHSKIVQPGQKPYRKFLKKLSLRPPKIPILSNVTADYYPGSVEEITELLVKQIASPVEFIREMEKMYADGVRLFVEVGPKRVLTALSTSIFENKKDAVSVSSNHPKKGGVFEFNNLLARLAAEGVKVDWENKHPLKSKGIYTESFSRWCQAAGPTGGIEVRSPAAPEALLRGRAWEATESTGKQRIETTRVTVTETSEARKVFEKFDFNPNPVMISGIAAGTPGSWDRLFRENALDDVLAGQNLIDRLPESEQKKQLDKNLIRVVKSETGDHYFQKLESVEQVIRLAARAGEFDLESEFGVRGSLASVLDKSSQMAMAAGILALKDAGIPLVRHYKTATTGSLIPTHWALPESLADGTGVIFASAFPGLDSLIADLTWHFTDKFVRKPAHELRKMYDSILQKVKDPEYRKELSDWYFSYMKTYGHPASPEQAYTFSRSWCFKVLCLGHSQMSQFIRARGPSAHANAACASTTQAVGIAEDWIRIGRAKRVIVIGADDVTNPTLWEWLGTSFLAIGATTTKPVVSEAALPFDRRRHGMIVGMGAVGIVIEDAGEVEKRGMRPLAELMATQYENSAFHITRLDTKHVAEVMERLVSKTEKKYGISRRHMAEKMLFMSHETYTPARGGSAAAEVEALKHTFGKDAQKIVVSNTKGFTGHSMGVSIEDATAIRALTTGTVPPIANYKEPDPDLQGIRLSDGGQYDLEYALRLAAGFGSQIAMTLVKRKCLKSQSRIADPSRHQSWLRAISGIESPELEVVKNTLRIKDAGPVKPSVPRKEEAPAKPKPVPVPAAQKPVPSAVEGPKSPQETAAGPAISEKSVTEKVLDIMAQKTGYPKEMLEPDLDMEADLGIDTVKQAEMFGIIRETFDIPRKEGLSLKDYPTLRKVIGFVLENTGQPVAALPAAPPRSSTSERASGATAPPEEKVQMDQLVTEKVLDIMAQKTGYPKEMLEPDLDMEADLGIDTVKQAEMFGIIRETFDIPRKEGLSLKDYPTLRKVIGFVLENTTPAQPEMPSSQATPEAPVERKTVSLEDEEAGFKRYVVVPAAGEPIRRVGGQLSKQPVLIASGKTPLAKTFQKNLKERGIPAVVTEGKNFDAAIEKLRKEHGKFQGLIFLRGLEIDEKFPPRSPEEFDKSYRESAKLLFEMAKNLAPDFSDASRPGWILTVTAMGGKHGYGSGTPHKYHPLQGALTGLTKSLSKEFPNAKVKAVDFESAESLPDGRQAGADTLAGTALPPAGLRGSTKDIAATALAELAHGDERVEVGFAKGERHTLYLKESENPVSVRNFGSEDVFLITGGAMNLGAELAKEIARKYGAKIAIFDIIQVPPEAEKWAAMSRSELADLKTRTWQDLKSKMGKKATPVVLEAEFSKITRAADASNLIKALHSLGSDVEYVSCDLTDQNQVKKAVSKVIKKFSKIDVLCHAAGMEKSKLIADKSVDVFDTVFRVKSHGLANLLAGLPESRERICLFFSSVSGRFGNIGQTDYSSANDFLSKTALWLRSRGHRAVSADLTAISGIGMSTRGGVKTFLESQGVEFMPPEVTMRKLLREIEAGAPDPEVVLAGKLGKFAEGYFAPAAQTTGAPNPTEALSGTSVLRRRNSRYTPEDRETTPTGLALMEKVVRLEADKEMVASKEFNLEKDPYLMDHRISGVPYVPGVMGLELFAETLAEFRSEPVSGLEKVRFSLPIKLLRQRPVSVRAVAKSKAQDGKNLSELSIESDFVNPQGVRMGSPRTHFSAVSGESSTPPAWDSLERKPAVPREPISFAVPKEKIYSVYFHGDSFKVLKGIVSISGNEVLAVYETPDKPLWPKPKGRLVIRPLLVEAAFQACGYLGYHVDGKMSLPDSIGIVRFYPGPDENLLFVHCLFKGTDPDGKHTYDSFVFDGNHNARVELLDYKMIPV